MATCSVITSTTFCGAIRPVSQRPRAVKCVATAPVRKVRTGMASLRRCGPQLAAKRSWVVRATGDEEKATEDEPVWVTRDREKKELDGKPQELPYGVYLLGSAILLMAVVGSMFELAAKNPIFGVVPESNVLYYPILAVFILTGPFTAWKFWSKAINAANAETERMDRMDGYK